MKIFHTVDLYNPFLCGPQQVVQQISERLVNRGHEVTVLTGYNPKRDFDEMNGVKIRQFKINGNHAMGIKGNKEDYTQFLLNSDYDVIMNYGTNVWTSDLTFDILHKIKCAKFLAPCGYSPLKSFLWRIVYIKYFRKLPHYLRQYDTIIYHSDNYIDKAFGDKFNIKNFVIIPNGASSEEFRQNHNNFREKCEITTSNMALTVGNHTKPKGHKFVINAFKKANRSDLTLVIIGNDVKSWRSSCAKKCSKISAKSAGTIRCLENCSREDIISAFFDADIFLLGSQVECSPVVIKEAMASHTPFISTNVGDVSLYKGGKVVESVNEMAYWINQIMENEGLRTKLGKIGQEEWRQKYTWEKITDMYEKLYLMTLRCC
jgi:glycosyltransferase involved in cell wall biosynthesis